MLRHIYGIFYNNSSLLKKYMRYYYRRLHFPFEKKKIELTYSYLYMRKSATNLFVSYIHNGQIVFSRSAGSAGLSKKERRSRRASIEIGIHFCKFLRYLERLNLNLNIFNNIIVVLRAPTKLFKSFIRSFLRTSKLVLPSEKFYKSVDHLNVDLLKWKLAKYDAVSKYHKMYKTILNSFIIDYNRKNKSIINLYTKLNFILSIVVNTSHPLFFIHSERSYYFPRKFKTLDIFLSFISDSIHSSCSEILLPPFHDIIRFLNLHNIYVYSDNNANDYNKYVHSRIIHWYNEYYFKLMIIPCISFHLFFWLYIKFEFCTKSTIGSSSVYYESNTLSSTRNYSILNYVSMNISRYFYVHLRSNDDNFIFYENSIKYYKCTESIAIVNTIAIDSVVGTASLCNISVKNALKNTCFFHRLKYFIITLSKIKCKYYKSRLDRYYYFNIYYENAYYLHKFIHSFSGTDMSKLTLLLIEYIEKYTFFFIFLYSYVIKYWVHYSVSFIYFYSISNIYSGKIKMMRSSLSSNLSSFFKIKYLLLNAIKDYKSFVLSSFNNTKDNNFLFRLFMITDKTSQPFNGCRNEK